MTDDGSDGPGEDFFEEVLQRAAVFDVLADRPLLKAELADELDVSKTTAHRIITSFDEKGLLDRTGQGYALTPYGRSVGEHVGRFRDGVSQTFRLRQFYEAVARTDVGVDFDAFSDATVTLARPGKPYGPVGRFVELLGASETLRGLDTTSVAPMYVEKIHEEIANGMDVEVVYEPSVVEGLVESFPDLAADAFEHENLRIFVAEGLPFGLVLFDDRVGVGGYDDEVGTLRVFVDTDDPRALEWGERVFERYREGADRVA